MANDKITIVIDLDDKDVKKAFATITKQGKKSAKDIGNSFSKRLTSAFRAAGRGLSRFGRALTSLKAAAAGIGAALLGGIAVRGLIEAAEKQEDAVNKLNTSLATAGTFSEEASQKFQKFASDMQKVTRVGDETTLAMAALARNFTDTNDEAIKLTEAAIQLSAAADISLDSAVKNLGKTFSGLAGEIGESVKDIRTLTTEELKAGAALDLVLQRFGTAAQSQVKTFSGATEQASNAFGDFNEKLGDSITRSPVVIELINQVGAMFLVAGEKVAKFNKSGDLMGTIISNAIQLGLTLNTHVIKPIEFLIDIMKILWDGTKLFLQFAVRQFAILGEGIGKVGNVLGIVSDETLKGLQDFSDSTGEVMEEMGVGLFETMDQSFKFDISQSTEDFLLNVQTIVDSVDGRLVPSFEKMGEASGKSVKKLTDDQKKLLASTKTLIGGALVNVVSTAFQALGASLIQGSSAWDNFKSAILNILGDLMIKIGTGIIAISTAIIALTAALTALFGPLGIIGGLALIAAGGALKAAAGGALMSAATGGAGAPATAPGDLAAAATEDLAPLADEADRQQPGTVVNVNVQGSIFDTTDTPRRLVELINEEFETKGTRLVRGIA